MVCGFGPRRSTATGPIVGAVDDTYDDLRAHYLADRRSHDDGRAWVLLNMITSIDGAIAVDGLSGGLGNDADFAVFSTLRSLADVILVGAGTAAAENYKVPKPSPEVLARRESTGQAPRPVIALVSRSLRIDLDSPLFADPTYRPIVVTAGSSPEDRRSDLAAVADVVIAGDDEVDFGTAIEALRERVGPVILAEGGPTLNGQLAAADVLDELCVTISPLVVGGAGGRMVAHGPDHDPRPFAVDRVAQGGGLIFTRMLRQR